MEKKFLGYSIKSWLIFLTISFLYGGFMGWYTDFTTTQISISAAIFAGIYSSIENILLKKKQ